MARGLKFQIYKVEGLYYLCSENKGADQLHGYRKADLRLCFRIYKIRFSHDAAQLNGASKSNFGQAYRDMLLPVKSIFCKIIGDYSICETRHSENISLNSYSRNITLTSFMGFIHYKNFANLTF